MVEFTIVVDIQGGVGHTDVPEGEARLIVGWLAGVADGCVGCMITDRTVVGWCWIVGGWLVDS